MGCVSMEACEFDLCSIEHEASQNHCNAHASCDSLPILLRRPLQASEALLITDFCKNTFLKSDGLLNHHDLAAQEVATEGIPKTVAIADPADRPVQRQCLDIENIDNVCDFRFLAVDPASMQSQTSELDIALLSSIQGLWTASGFGGTCIDFLSKCNDLKMTILVPSHSFKYAKECVITCLIGFLVYRIDSANRYMSIRRFAVMPKFRRQGHGRAFMDWCIWQPGVNFLSLTSVSRSVGFYRAIGFRKTDTWHEGGKVRPDDEPQPDQVYMEYHPKSGKGKRSKKRR